MAFSFSDSVTFLIFWQFDFGTSFPCAITGGLSFLVNLGLHAPGYDVRHCV